MNWTNLSIVLLGGGTLPYITYYSLASQAPEDVPGPLHNFLNIFGLGYITMKGSPAYHIDKGVGKDYNNIGQKVGQIGSDFATGYFSNFFANPIVIPLAIMIGAVVGGIVLFT